MSEGIDSQFWDIGELARMLGFSKRTIERMLKENSRDLPPSVKIRNRRKWHKQVAKNWIFQRVGLLTSQLKDENNSTSKTIDSTIGEELIGLMNAKKKKEMK